METATPSPGAAVAVPPLETVDGASLLSSMPAVNERAVATVAPDAAAKPAAVPAATGPEIRDINGTLFRPGSHRVKPDGSPFLGSKGQFMPRGGRRAGGVKAPAAEAPKPAAPVATGSTVPERILKPAPAAQPTAAAPEAARTVPVEVMPPVDPEMAEISADTGLRAAYHILDTLFAANGEWQPEPEAEHVSLKKTLIAWRTGKKPLPAWLSFTLAAVAYVLKRFRKPTTAKRLVTVFPDLGPVLGVEPPTPKQPAAKDAKPQPAAEEPKQPQPPAVRVPLDQRRAAAADMGGY